MATRDRSRGGELCAWVVAGVSDKPLTLANVRVHIERRIEHCVQMITDVPPASGRYQRANAVRYELTEILAMLGRVQDGGAR